MGGSSLFISCGGDACTEADVRWGGGRPPVGFCYVPESSQGDSLCRAQNSSIFFCNRSACAAGRFGSRIARDSNPPGTSPLLCASCRAIPTVSQSS